ncbi:thioredoxin-dependent thiol peroxidase [Aphanothece sacrum]|uniref:thioredoxin-dependent peroxiredoxin n=1 Tax=Aphanothece sacrum FPU1 TaxID=1920663 RepID=A0A401IGJ0_APHSA|nr:thioredoxin-dependent thiol peroxidase [Aphanothece sacrum]GBF80341.1 bacterioferritin comigratory protein [Aphanothece sacrum FPU1]GBF83748.1 bacterioferritin comigratory protein [Aphanothece sacrum FPU3]
MTNLLEIGQSAPNFSLENKPDNLISLVDFSGQWLVLYFYPKDNTPGCTTEAKDFTNYASEFDALGAKIIGISPDSTTSHSKFIEKHELSVTLLSDLGHKIAEAYGVWGLKKYMGKEYIGIIRSTFLIDPESKIVYIWSKVKVKNHAETVLNKLQEIQSRNT